MTNRQPKAEARRLLEALQSDLSRLRPPALDEPRFHWLSAAARDGNVEAMESFLSHEEGVEERSHVLKTAMLAACAAGHVAAVRLLLDHGASPEADRFDRSPLRHAVDAGQEEVVRLLVGAGASLSWPVGARAVVQAILRGRPGVATWLAEQAPEIQEPEVWFSRPGMSDLADIVEIAEIADRDRLRVDRVCRHAERRRQALYGGEADLASQEVLELPQDVEAIESVEEICARIQSSEFQLALEAGADAAPLLRLASRFGLLPVVEVLLDRGGPPDARDGRGRSALHYVAAAGLGVLGDRRGEAARQVAQRLLNSGVEVDGRDNSGQTPLMEAAASSDLDLVDLLLDAGADPKLEASGRSVAQQAKGPHRGLVVELLRERAPVRPAVVFARAEQVQPAQKGCRRWLDGLPGDGCVWALGCTLSELRASRAPVLGWRWIEGLVDDPAPRISEGWLLAQLRGSSWTFLWPMGWTAVRQHEDWAGEELSAALAPELLSVRVQDSTESIFVRRSRRGRVVERVTWETAGPCTAFRSELRECPSWFDAPRAVGNAAKAAHGRSTFERYFADLALEIPDHRLHFDGLDTQLIFPETARERIEAVVCLTGQET